MKVRIIMFQLALLTFLPELTNAQIYQGLQNSTATVVRDPARQSSTEIDAVINNPAGTAFLNDGWNLSLNGKLGYQSFDFIGSKYFDNYVCLDRICLWMERRF